MKLARLLPFYRNYETALSRVSALEMAFALMLESPRYAPSDAAGFNGQLHRKRIFRDLTEACDFGRIIETGTFIGDTAAYMATMTSLEVHTCEANRTFQALARSRLAGIPRIHFHTGDSRECVRRLIAEGAGQAWLSQPVFFYLDAHWHADLPLREEIRLIAEGVREFVVMVDDFRVPDDPGYGYDDYGRGRVLELATLAADLGKLDLQAFFPSLPSAQETGGRRGCVVLTRRGALTEKLRGFTSLRVAETPH